jgi:DNA-binding protein H-NS
MARVAVDKMTLKQIEALEEQISAAKAKAAAAAKADVKAKIDALLDTSGFTIADLYPHAGRRGKGKSIAKYANPADASQSWTGRGRRPAWLLAALKKGIKLESMAL